jgi:hypothetical protein
LLDTHVNSVSNSPSTLTIHWHHMMETTIPLGVTDHSIYLRKGTPPNLCKRDDHGPQESLIHSLICLVCACGDTIQVLHMSFNRIQHGAVITSVGPCCTLPLCTLQGLIVLGNASLAPKRSSPPLLVRRKLTFLTMMTDCQLVC